MSWNHFNGYWVGFSLLNDSSLLSAPSQANVEIWILLACGNFFIPNPFVVLCVLDSEELIISVNWILLKMFQEWCWCLGSKEWMHLHGMDREWIRWGNVHSDCWARTKGQVQKLFHAWLFFFLLELKGGSCSQNLHSTRSLTRAFSPSSVIAGDRTKKQTCYGLQSF